MLTGDIILAEVLQGFTSDRAFNVALRLMGSLDQIDIGGRDVAIQAARNFQTLRGKRITVRKTIDTLIATRRSEEHTSELQSLMRISYAVFCLKKKNKNNQQHSTELINRNKQWKAKTH